MGGAVGRGNYFSEQGKKGKKGSGGADSSSIAQANASAVPGKGDPFYVPNGTKYGGDAAPGNPNNPITAQMSPPGDPPASTAAATPPNGFDPLALQQIWASVLGPAFQDAARIGAQAGPDYLQAMTQAISGSHQSPQAQAQQMNQAKAMSSLLQGYAGSNLQQVAAGPSFDQLINWLQQATGAAQLAQGAAEKNISYGGALQNAAAFGSNPASAALGASQLSPQQAAALTQQALGGTQTGAVNTGLTGTTTGNPFLPNQLLQSQGLP